jgi:DNA invertase Pin-like site-specific DNA recombinase
VVLGHRHVDGDRSDVFQILGAIAEFEHALMSERTRDGLAAARTRGRTGGQKPKLTARQATIAQAM